MKIKCWFHMCCQLIVYFKGKRWIILETIQRLWTVFRCFTQGEKYVAGMSWHSGSHTLERYLWYFPLSPGFLLKIVLKKKKDPPKKKIVLKAVTANWKEQTLNLKPNTPYLIKYNWCTKAEVKLILKIVTVTEPKQWMTESKWG